jgi:uncharacterized protein (DUF1697 family)
MPRFVAFLRGINLGKRRLPMSRLVEIFEQIGHTEVKTFIASGNVLFRSPSKNAAALEKAASQQLENALGYEVDVFIRTVDAIVEIAQTKHFPHEERDGVTLHVGFVHKPFSPEIRKNLESIRTPIDEFKVAEREFYWLCRTRSSESVVWTLPEVKALRLPTSTLRNIKTIRKLATQYLQ